MLSVLQILGIDEDELQWHDLAMCGGMDRELFFDKYEADEVVAKTTDEVCLSCPVRKECLLRGIDNGEHGVWGGIYLTAGKPDEQRNMHKTDDIWEEIREGIIDVL